MLDATITDIRLRAVLGARWGDYGLPPGESAFLAHAVVTDHYFEGGYYPEGSSARLAAGAIAVIEAAGGQVRTSTEVAGILVERGRAVGVRLAKGGELRARTVISDAGARNTYLRLLPDTVTVPFRDELASTAPGMASITLYLGLSRSPEALGVRARTSGCTTGSTMTRCGPGATASPWARCRRPTSRSRPSRTPRPADTRRRSSPASTARFLRLLRAAAGCDAAKTTQP